MTVEKLREIVNALEEVHHQPLTDRQINYINWLIDQAMTIGGYNIGSLVCDYLKIHHQPTRKTLYGKIEKIIDQQQGE